MTQTPIALTIAGSDCSAGAGLQADLKTFSALGIYGTTIATVLTAQNNRDILAIHELPDAFITAQFEALFADLEISALKTGLLTSPAMIECVGTNIQTQASHLPLVIDPVMAATSGREFMDEKTRDAFCTMLAPMASLLTPNLDEAANLLGREPARNVEMMREQAEALCRGLGAGAVLLKGGHLEDGMAAIDILFDGERHHEFTAPRIETGNNRGTGCTLSAAITAHLARAAPLEKAVQSAKNFVTNALRHSGEMRIGEGPGPLNHGRAAQDEVDEGLQIS